MKSEFGKMKENSKRTFDIRLFKFPTTGAGLVGRKIQGAVFW